MLSTSSFDLVREPSSLARGEAAPADDPLDRSGSPTGSQGATAAEVLRPTA